MRRLPLYRGDLVLESLLHPRQLISLRLRFGHLRPNSGVLGIEFDQHRPLGQRGPAMTQLIGRRVIGLQVEKALEIAHGNSLTRADPCCRIDQFGVGGATVVVVVEVVDEVDEVEEVDGRVVVAPGRVVVVVDGRVVDEEDDEVDSTTVGSAPFRIP